MAAGLASKWSRGMWFLGFSSSALMGFLPVIPVVNFLFIFIHKFCLPVACSLDNLFDDSVCCNSLIRYFISVFLRVDMRLVIK
jgi:hypothetical protein